MKTYKEPYEVLLKRFCENLKEVLEETGLTQRKQILSGLDSRYISRIKKGQINPTLMTMWKICQAAGVDPTRLFEK